MFYECSYSPACESCCQGRHICQWFPVSPPEWKKKDQNSFSSVIPGKVTPWEKKSSFHSKVVKEGIQKKTCHVFGQKLCNMIINEIFIMMQFNISR